MAYDEKEAIEQAIKASLVDYRESHPQGAVPAAAAAASILTYRETTTTVVERFQMPVPAPVANMDAFCAALRGVIHKNPVSKNVSGTRMTDSQILKTSGTLRRFGVNGCDVAYLCGRLSYSELTEILHLPADDRKARISAALAARPPPTPKELNSAANATPLPDKLAPGGSKDTPERVGPRVGGFNAPAAGIEVIDVRPPNAANSFNYSDKI